MKKIKIKSTILRLPQGLRPFAMTGRKLSKKALAAFFTFILVILPVTLLILFNSAKGVEAAWANEDWGYRYPINITNSTGAIQTNLQKLLTIDTSTLVTAGKLQSDCDDLRFTAQNGTVLPYYIDSGCNTTTTKVWVLLDSVPTNGSTIYMYYGNPSISAGTSPKEFDNVVGLVGYWTMNDTSGSTATDSSVNANNGTATGTTIVSGQKGNARSFNGTSDYISVTTTGASFTVQTVEAWIYKTGDGYIIDQGGNNNWMQVYDGRIRGGTDASGYCDGSTTIASNTWYHVVKVNDGITNKIYVNGNLDCSNTIGIGSPGAITIGRYGGGGIFFPGQIDDVRIYNTARTADQISSDYTKTYTIQTSPLTVTTANGSEEKAPSPVAYWKFDDGTGTTAQDSTTNNNDGTLTNGPSWQTEDMCVSGKCLKFDGTDDYVVVTDNSSLDVTNRFTFSVWFKATAIPASDNTAKWFFGKDVVGGRSYDFGLWNTSGTVNLTVQINGTNRGLSSTAITADNKWHHAIVVYDGSNVTYYLDGRSDGSAASVDVAVTTTNLRIGGREYVGFTEPFSGFLDEPKVYNYARSADQIKADYNSRANSEGAASVLGTASNNNYKALNDGLVGYWKMDESSWTNNCTATSVTDSSGNSNNGKACPNTTGPTGGASGKFGNAGSFDGSDDYVEIANSTSLQPLTGNWAVGFWMYRLGIGSGDFPQIIGSRPWTTSVDKGWAVAWDSANNKICPHFADGSTGFDVNNVTCSSSTSTLNTWEHWTVVFDRTNSKVNYYKNGVLDGSISVTYPSGSINQTDTVNIAREIGGLNNRRLNARLDETRVYNRALSPAEVTQLYNFAPGPVAYYNFEENTGTTVNDRSGNANTGTWNGSGSPKWKPGKYGTGGNFDGSSDYVEVTDTTILRPTGTITVEAWAKSATTNWNSDGWFISNRTATTFNGYILHPTSGGKEIAFYVGTGSAWISTTYIVPDITVWHHYVGVYDGTKVYLYVDGVLVSSTSGTGSISYSGSSTRLRIGSDDPDHSAGGGRFGNGQIDDVKIYNYARTQDQIISDMQGSSGTATFSLSSSGLTAGSNTKPAAPVGYWKFDEGYGTTANNVGNGGSSLNGTLTNMASPATSTSGWTQAGKVGKGLVFDGTDDYVSLPNDSALNITSNQITMSAWVYRTVTGDFDQVISKATGTGTSSRQYAMYIDATAGGLGCNVVAGSVVDLISSIIRVTTNTWTHISCVYDGATLKGYVNGIQASSTALTGNIVTQNTGVNIGRFNTGVSYFNGTLDEVKIYNFPLTADQVKLDMNQGAALVLGSASNNSSYEVNAANQEYCIPGDTATCAAPVGRWDFDEATGTTANDSSGNANTGTLTNGPTWKPGKVNKSVNFDGTDDRVQITSSSGDALDLTTNMTVSAWINPTAMHDTNNYIISRRNSTNGYGYSMYLNNENDKFRAFIATSAGNCGDANSTTTINTNTWYHVSFTYDGTNLRYYINGRPENIISCTQTSPSQTTNLLIGIYNDLGTQYAFNGKIDQVRIFNYARSAAQIAWDYNRGAPVAHYRLDECQGTSAKDVSGNSNTGTITIGSSGTQTTAGTCTDGSSTSAWYNGRTGKKNYSLNFDGTDDYIALPSGASSNLNVTSDLTIAAWIKTSSDSVSILSAGDNAEGTAGYLLGINQGSVGTGKISFYTTSGGWDGSTGTVNDGTWHHIVISLSGTTVSFYIDGKTSGTATSAAPASWSGNRNLATNNTANGVFFSGQIDDTRIYNYALTATQVKTLFNEGAYRVGPSTGAP